MRKKLTLLKPLNQISFLRSLAVLLLLIFSFQTAKAQTCPTGQYVVGYQPSWAGTAQEIEYDKLSHIIYSFIRPTTTGGLTAVENPQMLRDIVSLAHARGVRVQIAVGGWSDLQNGDFQSMAANSTYRANFINNLVSLVNTYGLDGVDIDWEYPEGATDSNNFAILMNQLGTAMHSRGKLLSAAVSAHGYYANFVKSSVFADVDFLNLMAYDGGDGAAHSPYSLAVTSLDYWLGRGLPRSKAVVGVPFYGRPTFKNYKTLLAEGANAYSDVFNGVYYNGITTIKQKAELGKTRGAGIMIWELSQDVHNQYSLVRAINEVITPCKMGGSTCNPIAIVPYLSVNNGSWQQVSSASLNVGGKIVIGPHPLDGSWKWSGPSGFSSTARQITVSNIQPSQGGNYVATYTNPCGAASTRTFSITVTGGSTTVSTTVEAENYVFMSGVIKETCYDQGGGQNIGSFDANDWTSYNVSIPTSGTYKISYRVASIHSGRSLRLEKDNGQTLLGTIGIPNTGSWQKWTSISHNVTLPAGNYPVGIATSTGGFNLNRWHYTNNLSARIAPEEISIEKESSLIYPNPIKGKLNLSHAFDETSTVQVLDLTGNQLMKVILRKGDKEIDLNSLAPGGYLIKITTKGSSMVERVYKE